MSVRRTTFFEDLADGKLSLDKVPAWAWYLLFLAVCYVGYLLRQDAASHARADQFLIDHGIPPRLR